MYFDKDSSQSNVWLFLEKIHNKHTHAALDNNAYAATAMVGREIIQ